MRRLVSSRLALDLSRRSPRSIAEIFTSQAKRHRCKDLAAYAQQLRSEKDDAPVWTALIDELTIAETYFFRDPGQMQLLRQELFPRLIKESGGRPLKIWSAGCSTGEEPYSLAMVLDQIAVPRPPEIIGSDVNPQVLRVARAGIYRERSLRSTPPELRDRYFKAQPGKDTWQLLPRIRDQVAFQPDNLARPSLAARTEVDLIVCRNVLIYFERELVAAILERFTRCLRPGGFLLVGHCELQGLERIPLEVRSFEHSVVYQKPERALSTPPQPSKSSPPLPPRPLVAQPEHPLDLATLVERCLNQGHYTRGRAACQEAAARHPLDLQPPLLESRLARAQGLWSEARQLVARALYLNPDHPASLLELALHFAHRGDWPKARKLREESLQLGQVFPDTLTDLDARLRKSGG